ncbi:MAG: ATP-dependent Clp protease ATP-binding subunit [Clostridia bacterium]|nr:ATP-dependent Clp protease ATP-binding subunit [Clostridia bacterium]
MKVCSICKKNPAVVFVSRSDGTKMINEGYCFPCAIKNNITPVNQLADQFGIEPDEIQSMMSGITDFLENGDFNEAFEDIMGGGNLMMPINSSSEGERIPIKDNEIKKGIKNQQRKKKCLNNFGVNLTEKAKQSLLDRVVGREKEIDRAIQILNRRQKNNPVLLGAPGVGKTAVAEGIAQRIADGDVPERLQDAQVYLLDMSGIVAGTQYRGQFESRLKNIIEEASHDNTILVIDEIHSIVSAGDADGAMNAANILKPALAKGEIQVIGATTLDEYRKHIEKDAALERRFQPVMLDEPSVEETIDILMGTKDYYEDFHNITIDASIIRDAVVLADKYINDRFFPDKAIDVIDEAASRLNMDSPQTKSIIKTNAELGLVNEKLSQLEEETETPQYEEIAKLKSEKCRLEGERLGLRTRQKETKISISDVAKVIELWTGIPVRNITETDKEKLINLEDRLHKRVVGQDKAVSAVARAVRRNRALKLTKKRPVSFIFVGPTGVGKTELVKALSQSLFDDERSLIRLDMSEYMEKHSVAKITGSPPGYVGYDDGGQLTEKVRRKPYSVILLDEIEKAHADVFNILLQILDDGRITDSHGKTVNFENTIIIMTSNAGTSVGSASAAGFMSTDGGISTKIMESLKEIFRPEFLNRVDEVIEFSALTKENLMDITDLMLKDMVAELAGMGIGFEITDEAKALIVDRAYTPRYGARPIRREIQTSIEDAVSGLILSSELGEGSMVRVEVLNGEIKVNNISK